MHKLVFFSSVCHQTNSICALHTYGKSLGIQISTQVTWGKDLLLQPDSLASPNTSQTTSQCRSASTLKVISAYMTKAAWNESLSCNKGQFVLLMMFCAQVQLQWVTHNLYIVEASQLLWMSPPLDSSTKAIPANVGTHTWLGLCSTLHGWSTSQVL